MKRTVTVTHTVEVEVDETLFTEEWLAEWRQSFYNFHSVERHIEHIAQLEACGLLHKDFTEGYGPLADMSISAQVVNQETELERV